MPTPPDVLDGLTSGYSAAFLGALFVVAGGVAALVRPVDVSQVDTASAVWAPA